MQKLINGSKPHHPQRVTAGLFALLCAGILISLKMGHYPLGTREILRVLLQSGQHVTNDSANIPWVVVKLVRLPRVLLATLCGMGLSLSGAALQGVFRNPLVGPEIAGVSAGSAFGGVLGILWSLPLAGVVGLAFVSGLSALLIAFGLTKVGGGGRGILALVLSGVIVGTFFGALTSLVELAADPNTTLPSILYWLMGSFASASYQKLALMSGTLLAAGVPLMLLRWRLNLLSLGGTDAAALGVHLEALRWIVVALSALIVAVQVSVSGGVGWVGLVIPHLARMLVGPEHTRLLPVAAILGGLYLLFMDDIARSLGREEIPIGLLTAIVGAPVFGLLFWKTRGNAWSSE